jgi:hypothetical protein
MKLSLERPKEIDRQKKEWKVVLIINKDIQVETLSVFNFHRIHLVSKILLVKICKGKIIIIMFYLGHLIKIVNSLPIITVKLIKHITILQEGPLLKVAVLKTDCLKIHNISISHQVTDYLWIFILMPLKVINNNNSNTILKILNSKL